MSDWHEKHLWPKEAMVMHAVLDVTAVVVHGIYHERAWPMRRFGSFNSWLCVWLAVWTTICLKKYNSLNINNFIFPINTNNFTIIVFIQFLYAFITYITFTNNLLFPTIEQFLQQANFQIHQPWEEKEEIVLARVCISMFKYPFKQRYTF